MNHTFGYVLCCQSPALFLLAIALVIDFFVRKGRARLRAILALLGAGVCIGLGFVLYYQGMLQEYFEVKNFWRIRAPGWVGLVLAAATVCGIIGAGGAALRGTRRADRLPVWLGYGLLILSVGLLIGQPLLARYAIAALLFKFTWTFVLPFILARVAGLDNNGRLMNSINLVIGGGMAAGPALAGALLQHFASADPLLAAAGVCALLSLILIVAASAAGKA